MTGEEYKNNLSEIMSLAELVVEIKKEHPEFSERLIGFRLGYEFATKRRTPSWFLKNAM